MPASDVPWLGARLRAERMRRGISLRSLARDVGVSASMISQIETGKSRPSVSTLYAITSALGISIEDVFSAPSPATESMLGESPAGTDLATSDRTGTDRAGTDRASTGAAVDALTGSGRPTTVIEVRAGRDLVEHRRADAALGFGVWFPAQGRADTHARVRRDRLAPRRFDFVRVDDAARLSQRRHRARGRSVVRHRAQPVARYTLPLGGYAYMSAPIDHF
jgi:transcriptional regulator with XRE-family HTH domain